MRQILRLRNRRSDHFLIQINVLPTAGGYHSCRMTALQSMRALLLGKMFADPADRFWRDAKVRRNHPLRHLERDRRIRLQEVQVPLFDRHAQRINDSAVLRSSVFLKCHAKHRRKSGDTLDDYRAFLERHLFPTLRIVPGYAGTFLGRDPNSGQLISLSFWHSEADAVRGEEAVGRAIRGLPQGSAPRPSNVVKYVIEYRDIKETLSK
jgi:hypothetical protein